MRKAASLSRTFRDGGRSPNEASPELDEHGEERISLLIERPAQERPAQRRE